MDNGYYDMYKIMEALVEVNYDGIVILDHTPFPRRRPQRGAGLRLRLHESIAESRSAERAELKA